MNKDDFDLFFQSMLVAALWSTLDDNGEPLDSNHAIGDFTTEGLEILKAHALSFFSRCWFYVDHEEIHRDMTDLGHDFWLTSAGHGAGFWDGDWPTYGDRLTELSKCYPFEHIDLTEYLK